VAVGRPLHLRLFLEGEEVPVISANVQITPNSPAAASIQIIPVDSALDLHARTMVHLFYLESWAKSPKGREIGTTISADQWSLNSEYRLLFAGEIIGYQFQQTPQSRALILQCVDFSSYWDTAHATSISYGLGGNWATDTTNYTGGDRNFFDDLVSHQPEKIVAWLKQAPLSPGLSTVSGLAGGIIRIMEAMGGIFGKEKGINDFFTIAELRCKLLQQVTAEENDNTAANLLKVQVFDEWLRNGLQSIGQKVTFRDIMKLLFQYIYYDIVPNPAAMWDAGNVGVTTVTSGEKSALSKQASVIAILGLTTTMTARMLRLVSGRSGGIQDFGPNVIVFRETVSANIEGLRALKGVGAEGMQTLAKTIASFETAESLLSNMARIRQPTSYEPLRKVIDALVEAKKLLTEGPGDVTGQDITSNNGREEQLHTQIFRPDCWFAAPPICNVVFPEQYVTLSFERVFIGEVTRVLIQLYSTLTTNVTSATAGLESIRILAPNFTDVQQVLASQGADSGYRILMEHELHTGIIPREEWLPNTAAVTKDSSQADQAAPSRLSWGQRVALFHFLKYRYAPRNASVSGKFNPNLVCGFPAAVIRGPYIPDIQSRPDPQLELNEAIKKAKEQHAPYHLIGMIGSLSHGVDQSGGATSFTLHHLRYHSGDDDEFISLAKKMKSITTYPTWTLSYDDALSMDPNILGDRQTQIFDYLAGCTPQSSVSGPSVSSPNLVTRETTPSGGVTSLTEKKNPGQSKDPEGCTKGTFDGGKVKGWQPLGNVSITREMPGPYGYGKVASIQVVDPMMVPHPRNPSIRMFKKVIIYLSLTQDLTDPIPAEEIIRPRGWFSPKYANQAIGAEIYKPFFGCGSVIDELTTASGAPPDPLGATEQTAPALKMADGHYVIGAFMSSLSTGFFHNIENSLNSLAFSYGKVKKGGGAGDVDEFIRQHTARKIATLDDIFGDLRTMKFKALPSGKAVPVPATARVGFHTASVHKDLVESGVPLAGLVESNMAQLSRIGQTGPRTAILGNYDVRKQKRQRVLAYLRGISKRGLRG
jgi:hypothetical protein